MAIVWNLISLQGSCLIGEHIGKEAGLALCQRK